MDIALGLCFLSAAFAAALYVGDWLDDGRGARYRRWRGLPSLPTMASFCLSAGFFFWNQHARIRDSLPELAAFVAPYPDAVVADRSTAAGYDLWTLETPDSPQQVVAFYQELESDPSWNVHASYRRNPWLLWLRRPGIEVVVRVRSVPRATSILYTVRERGEDEEASASGKADGEGDVRG